MENTKPPRSKQANSLTDPQPSTSRQTDKTPVESKATGGGGADSAHGQAFHFNVAQLMLFGLYEESKSELGFDYKIWLEKEGYGKFDDIVVQYKKPEGKTMQICVQCKHGEEKIHSDGTKTVKNITAVDFLSNRNKSFSLAEYIRSFVTIQNKNIKIFDLETYFVLLSNRAYMSEKDSSFAFLERDENVDINQLFALDIFEHDCFRIKCNDNFGDFLQKQISSNGNADTNVTNDVIRDFCDKFIYIRDKRELDHVLEQKILQHCRQNSETAKNLKARLYYLVSQMYQHKTNPTKNDIIYEFNGTNVYFRVPPACPKFSGRVIEIQRIKEALECEKKCAVFDLLVTGMAGMGKTQIFRKYIDENRQKYKHVVWINAENKDTLEKSFVELAKDCKLISSDSKDETTIIVKAIYSYFRDQTLFVFDNTNKVLLSKNEDEKYIYLPINDKYKQNKFIIISQDQKWTTNHLPIVVDKFIDADALIYLDASIECSRNDKIKLAFSFQYWPLALCLAVSYIKLETENSLGCRSCSDVIDILQIEMFNKHKPVNHEMEPYTNSLNSLWLTIHNKLQAENKHSIEILNVLAFSHPDNFPVKLLKFDDVDEWQVKAAVNTLKNYSIVNVSDFKISIHRTLQSVIKATIMSDIDLYETVLLKTSQCFNIYLQSMDPNEKMKTLGNFHMVTFLQHTNQSNLDPQKYIKMANRLLQKLNDSQDLMGYSETQGIFYQILKVAEDALGVNHEDNLCAIMRTAQMLYTTGKFAESLDHINNLLAKYTEKFGNKHYKTLGILGMKAFVLNQMGEYEKALSIYNHVIEIETEILGDEHPSLLTSMHNKALVLKEIGEYEKALSIYNHVIEIRTEILGEKHPSLLTSMHNKASVLKEIGEFEKALSIYNQVIEIETEILGDKHPSLLTSMHNKALVLKQMGEHEKALSIFNQVIKIETEILGDKHPSLLTSMHNKALVLEEIGEYEKALSIYNHVIEIRTEILGEKHPSLLTSMHNKASVLKEIGEFEKALSIYNQVIEIETEILGDKHPSLLTSMHNKASVLEEIGEYEKALSIYNHVIEIMTEILGEKHPSLLTSMHNKASVLKEIGEFEKALSIYNHVIEIRTEILGEKHPCLLTSMHNKALVLKEIGEFEKALSIYNHVIEIETEILGDKHPSLLTSMHNKARVLEEIGEYEKALSIYDHVIEIETEIRGEKHPSLLTSMHNKALVLKQMGEYEKALSINNHVIEIETEILGDEHPSLLTSMHNKALVLEQMGEHEKALSIFNQVIKIETEILGDKHPSLLTSMHNKARVLEEIGEYEKALSIYDHVIEIETEIRGEKHPSLLTSMHNKALVLKQMGEYEKALSINNHVIEIRTEILGEKHPSLLNSMHNKALVLNLMGEYEKALSIYNHVIEMRIKILGEKHPHTVQSIKARENALESIRLKNVRRCLILTLSTLSMFAIYKILSRLR